MGKQGILSLVLVFGFLLCGSLTWILEVWPYTPPQHTPTPRPTPSVNELIEMLSSPDVRERERAADLAGSYRYSPDRDILVPYLVGALSDYAGSVYVFAAQSIHSLGVYDEQAVEIFISWLEWERCGEATMQGIAVLEDIADYAGEDFATQIADATPGLIRLMARPSNFPQCQLAAAHTLSAIGDPVAVPYLLAAFLSPGESWFRKGVAIDLAEFGPEAICAVPYLVPLLEYSEPDVRIGAAVIINQATGNDFPDGERDNWATRNVRTGGLSCGPWSFEQGADGEYLIVAAAREWWREAGQYEDWPECSEGLEGEPVPPPVGPDPYGADPH